MKLAPAVLAAACAAWSVTAAAQAPPPLPVASDGISALVRDLEAAVLAGDAARYLAHVLPAARRDEVDAFAAANFVPGVSRVVLRERDRTPLPGSPEGTAFRLVLELFTESGPRGHVATWRLDVRQVTTRGASPLDSWGIVEQEVLTEVNGLYRLSLVPTKQYAARGLRLHAEDLTLEVADGSAFVAETVDGITGLVVLGRVRLTFDPKPPAERGQVKIFSGEETLHAQADALFVRLNPYELDLTVAPALAPRPVDVRALRRAEEVFAEFVGKSFSIDLHDLSRDLWSLTPGPGDFLAEIRTRKYGTLTYARSATEAEDITLFDRKRKRNIAIYPSQQKLAVRGPYYDEDQLTDYDVLDYSIDVAFAPDREWVQGRARLWVKVRAYALATLNLRLAEALEVDSVVSNRFGRLLHLRVRGQNSVIVNLPTSAARDEEFGLTVTYGGRLPPQPLEREALAIDQESAQEGAPVILPEPRFIYSSRSFWYPQATVTDYATATLRVTVPAGLQCVASGEPTAVASAGDGRGGREYAFEASQPVRYLAVVISKFTRVGSDTVRVGGQRDEEGAGVEPGARPASRAGVFYDSLALTIAANPRQQGRARDLGASAADILRFYTSLVADFPYPGLTLAVTEDNLPGGHSPAYFAMVNQPLPTSPFVWRNDPVSFEGFPQFFVAHELAHQWWGQAVGWKNYHEQWLSEGFAQYFAALYGEQIRGKDAFTNVLRQMRRTAIEFSSQGPVYLGYRLGHIRGESRVFRALVYNKGAMVLHMLRRLVGDDVFRRGLRRFYAESRFHKAGTNDLERAFEAEAHVSLDRFFERWIHDARIPRLRFSARLTRRGLTPAPTEEIAPGPGLTGEELVVRFEQGDEIFDVPVTVTLIYASGATSDIVVPVADKSTEVRIPLTGPLRDIEVNRDYGALAEFVRVP